MARFVVRVPPCLDWLQTPSRTAQAFSAAFDCSHSLRTHKMWRFELAVAFLSFVCIAPRLNAAIHDNQKPASNCDCAKSARRDGRSAGATRLSGFSSDRHLHGLRWADSNYVSDHTQMQGHPRDAGRTAKTEWNYGASCKPGTGRDYTPRRNGDPSPDEQHA